MKSDILGNVKRAKRPLQRLVRRFRCTAHMPSSGIEIETKRGVLRIGIFQDRPPSLWQFAFGSLWLNAPPGSWQLRVWRGAVAWNAAPNTELTDRE